MPKNTTFVSFLLDETGSMQSVQAKTVDGFNSYVETLQKDAADMVFSLVSFNSNETSQRYIAEPLDAVTPLSHAAYCPAAMTPLIDASVKIIKATDDAATAREPSDHQPLDQTTIEPRSRPTKGRVRG